MVKMTFQELLPISFALWKFYKIAYNFFLFLSLLAGRDNEGHGSQELTRNQLFYL